MSASSPPVPSRLRHHLTRERVRRAVLTSGLTGGLVLFMIAVSSVGLKKLCKANPHWPSHETFYQWLRKYPDLADLYASAKKDQVTALVEDILEIADDSTQDEIIDEHGNSHANNEFINRSRIRIDTRKWIATKLVPRLYGDNVGMRELYEEIAELKMELEAKGVERNVEQVDSKSD